MRNRLTALALALLAAPALASWPPNFFASSVGSGWNQPVGITFAQDGRMFVWEKGGRVWRVENGVKQSPALLDLSQEVGNWRDYGMLGFALDPDFATNGYVYAMYVVDWHHLQYFGTPQYSPTTDAYFRDTIGRIVRYQCNAAQTVVEPGSRTILVGESKSTGIPICHQSHGIGSLVFGEDGTLLASAGDGASYDVVDTGQNVGGSSNTALAEGILRPKEAVGAFRSQLVDCLAGKVLRIDPATGDGVPSNPFYDGANPRAPRSRVWALGFRNPFRMVLVAGSGSTDPAAGDPGTLLVSDVGWNSREEVSTCDGPAQNFGWPLFEGLTAQASYQAQTTQNQDAPNPLAGGSCATFFRFRDLLVQETLAAPSWPNPCNTSAQVPASIPRFEHARPWIDYGHGNPTRTGIFAGPTAATIEIDEFASPLQGVPFDGFSATAGAWYSGGSYPPAYHGTLFLSDYVGGWIKNVVFDSSMQPFEVRAFGTNGQAGACVGMAVEPTSGDLYFIDYGDQGAPAVRHVQYVNNAPPVAVATPPLTYGPSPLTIAFSSAGTFDPENQALTYAWDFGDGAKSSEQNPVHTFVPLQDVTSQGTIIARLFELVPPTPQGSGSQNPQIIRDGDFPPVGNLQNGRQYDTYHGGQQGSDDWIGYALPVARELRRVVFQEGKHFADGGWFDTLRVEYGDGTTWNVATGLSIGPAYGGNDGLTYETHTLDFDPVVATHVRIRGDPGGSANFISVGELRIFATGVPAPVGHDVRLRVTDPFGMFSEVQLLVSVDNTPPQVAITSPLDGSHYPMTPASQTFTLGADIVDAEHNLIELDCQWQTRLHHNEHDHPEPFDPNCWASTVITPYGCDDQTYWYEVELTVTDAGGLATSAVSRLYPDCCQGGPAPATYCTGKTNSQGCVPAIAMSGTPSLTASAPFVVSCSNVVNQKFGMLYYGFAEDAAPFQGGTRCVATPIRRTPLQFSAGNPPPGDCSGSFAFDFNAWMQSGADANLLVGRLVHCQYWYRDPLASFGSGLSDGGRFAICP